MALARAWTRTACSRDERTNHEATTPTTNWPENNSDVLKKLYDQKLEEDALLFKEWKPLPLKKI